LITRLDDRDKDALATALDYYLGTLPSHWRRVLSGYTLVDAAHKVVGVGSVGLRAYVALCEGSSDDEPEPQSPTRFEPPYPRDWLASPGAS